MGRGSYSSADWIKLKNSRCLDNKDVNTIFVQKKVNQKYDPAFISKRESRNSEEHPNSTPIMIGVDVTGSMGYLSEQIIKESLNELMMQLYSTSVVEDPQLLFAAIGDARIDSSPLQVTQFESDIRIAEQLMELWLEGKGGDSAEDYELLWYFAAHHTDIDSYNKFKKKGFCFTIGDADCHETLYSQDIQKIFHDSVNKDQKSSELAKLASEKYELFHIVIDGSVQNLSKIIPGRVVKISKMDIKYLPEIIISCIQMANGKTKEQALNQWGKLERAVIANALKTLCIVDKDIIYF